MFKYIEILTDWNFWNNKIDLGVTRASYLEKLVQWLDLPEIVALYGVRRSGKSTILLQLIDKLHRERKIPFKNFLYVNFEDPRFGDEISAKDLFDIVDEYINSLKPVGKVFLFLDEVQRVKEWERFALTVYEQKKDIKIFVTGSSSSLLNSELSSLLSGRMLLIPVMPLTFKEFLQFKKAASAGRKRKLEMFEEYTKYGGFPRVVLEDNEINKRSILTSYYSTILEKDVILRNRIRGKTELKNLAKYIMSNNGSIFSTYSMEKVLGISNVNISKYIKMMADSFLIYENDYFSHSVKKQIYNPAKIYSVDTGLPNVAGFNFSENKGRLLENIVNNELLSRDKELFYWKNSTELDFVVFSEKKVQELINVTLTVDAPEVLERETISLEKGSRELGVKDISLLTLYNESRQKSPIICDLFKFLDVF